MEEGDFELWRKRNEELKQKSSPPTTFIKPFLFEITKFSHPVMPGHFSRYLFEAETISSEKLK